MEYAAIFRRLPIPLAVVDHDLRVLDANEAYARIAGVPVDDLVGTRLAIQFAGRHADDVVAAVRNGGEFELSGSLAETQITVRMSAAGFENSAHAMAVVHVAEASANSADALSEIQSAIREIRHEINNPLTGALGNINLLLRRDDLDDKTRRRLTTAEQEIKKVSLIALKLADLAPRGGDGSA